MKHSPEPWIISDGKIISAVTHRPVLTDADWHLDDMERSMAAVNACKGIIDPEATVPKLVDALKRIVESGGIGPEDMFDDARAALANVKGGS